LKRGDFSPHKQLTKKCFGNSRHVGFDNCSRATKAIHNTLVDTALLLQDSAC